MLSSSYPSLCGHRLTGKMILNDDNPLALEYSTPCWGPNSCSIISLLLLPAIISICVYPTNFRHKMVGFIPTSLGLFGVSQAQLLFFPRFLSPNVSRGSHPKLGPDLRHLGCQTASPTRPRSVALGSLAWLSRTAPPPVAGMLKYWGDGVNPLQTPSLSIDKVWVF